MSFGFSIGDVTALFLLVNKTRQTFIDAPAQFRNIQNEVKSLSYVLLNLQDVVTERSCPPSVSQNLYQHISDCNKLVEDVNNTLRKYHSIDDKGSKVRRVWQRLRWEPDDIKDLRARLSSNTALLSGFNDLLNRHLVSDVQDGVEKLMKHDENENFVQITSWLSNIDVAGQHRDLINRRKDNTGHWFLGCRKYLTWLETPGDTLFCPGIPGGGKTMIAAGVIEDLWDRFQNNQSVGIAFVYCSYKRHHEQSLEYCLASILKQLVLKLDGMPQSVQNSYDQHRSRTSRPNIEELVSMLQAVVGSYSMVYCVIDALDEYCSEPQILALLLSKMFQLRSSCNINLLATSRPNIQGTTLFFDQTPAVEISAQEEDVRKVMEFEMPYMPNCVSNSTKLQELIKEKIIEAAGGMFLLVQLHLNSLRDKLRRKQVIRALEDLPRGQAALDSAYANTIERVDAQPPGRRDLAKSVLMWISHARRPLTVTELRHALAVETGDTKLDDDNLPELEDMVSACQGLVTIDEKSNNIRLVHFTTQEYLDRISDIWTPRSHNDIALTCITYLSFDEFAKGMCDNDKEFEDRLERNALLDYAARNWGDHVRDANNAEANREALIFLSDGHKIANAVQVCMISTYHSSGYSYDVPKKIEAMHLAAQFGLSKVITQLLLEGRYPEPRDDFDRTPLSYAAEHGHGDVVELFTARTDVVFDLADKSGRTPLFWASGNSHVDVMQKLLRRPGVSANSKDSALQSPLSWAARRGRVAAVNFLLTCSDVEKNSCDRSEQTPLSWAAYNGHLDVVKLLVTIPEVKIDSKDSFSQTPLSWAARNGYLGVVCYLVNLPQVDPNSRDSEGRTPLTWASNRGHLEVVKLLASIPSVEADVKDWYGQTPLSWAAREGHLEVVKYLMSRSDVDTMAKDKRGLTPQRWATWNGYDAVAKALAEKRAEERRRSSATPINVMCLEHDSSISITKQAEGVTVQVQEL